MWGKFEVPKLARFKVLFVSNVNKPFVRFSEPVNRDIARKFSREYAVYSIRHLSWQFVFS